MSSFKIDVISWNSDVHSSSEHNTAWHTLTVFLWATNLIGGFDRRNVILRINLDFNLLPDVHSVLEQCPAHRLRKVMLLQVPHPFRRFHVSNHTGSLLKCTVSLKNVLFRFSYLILPASCSVFSLISTMTWDTGFNIRLSTFTCKIKHFIAIFSGQAEQRTRIDSPNDLVCALILLPGPLLVISRALHTFTCGCSPCRDPVVV